MTKTNPLLHLRRNLISFSLYLLALISGTALISCKKNSSPEQGAPYIVNFSPASVAVGDEVVITGNNFSTTASNNIVSFEGIPAIVKKATVTELTVIVPAGISTGRITVMIGNLKNTSLGFFTRVGKVATVAGNGEQGYVDGPASQAEFQYVTDVAFDQAGNLYIADAGNYRIRKLSYDGVVSTVAGNGSNQLVDGTGSAASFSYMMGIALDKAGNIYVADQQNNCIRKITPAGVVSTLAGNGGSGFVDGFGASAKFNLPTGVTVDASDNIYVSDAGNHSIRKITPAGAVTTVAGNGNAGWSNAVGTIAMFNKPFKITADGGGNLYVLDNGNNHIRKIDNTGLTSGYAGQGIAGFADGSTGSARFSSPAGLAFDASGNLYVADLGNQRIRKVSNGNVTTTAGTGDFGYKDGTGTQAMFYDPNGIAISPSGTIYVADNRGHRIRTVSP